MTKKKLKIDKNSRPFKYFVNRQKGMTKKDASIEAGYHSGPTNIASIEGSETYKAIEARYNEILTGVITMQEIAEYHADNIRQDTDRGARNKAIEMALAKLEPDKITSRDDDKIVVVLRNQ